jgi:PTH2 family peptidyl-tRNA hydrolase
MNVKQVIVIRRDLKMRRGKEIAQGAHASTAWIARRLIDRPSSTEAPGARRVTVFLTEAEHQWMNSGYRKICCTVTSEEELLALVAHAREAGVNCDLIQDAGTTEFGGVPTYTAAAFGPDTDEELDPITGNLTLY